MSGPYALAAAARFPDRIAAAASFYGTWIVSDAEESPHLSLRKAKGELYIGCAEHDELAPLPMVAELQGLFEQSGATGELRYRAGAAMASADELRIKVTGRQGHAGYPWRAVDPVTTAAQIVLGLQTVVSRRTDLMKSPTVVSVSTINGGSRFNIVPDTVEMTGTIRTFDPQVRAGVHRDIHQVAENIASSANAKAEVDIIELYDPLVNNDRITARMLPVLRRAADDDVAVMNPSGASEDFSFFLNEVPGTFFFLGVVPRDRDLASAAPNHSPNFYLDEKALVVGVRALAMVTANYLIGSNTGARSDL